jgi:leishmanolysin
MQGISNTFLITPNIVQVAKSYFGCDDPDYIGLPTENNGGSGTAGSHWERLTMYNDIMSGAPVSGDRAWTIFDIAIY